MSKALWVKAHEALIQEFLANHESSWEWAYSMTADKVQERYTDYLAAEIDEARERQKDRA